MIDIQITVEHGKLEIRNAFNEKCVTLVFENRHKGAFDSDRFSGDLGMLLASVIFLRATKEKDMWSILASIHFLADRTGIFSTWRFQPAGFRKDERGEGEYHITFADRVTHVLVQDHERAFLMEAEKLYAYERRMPIGPAAMQAVLNPAPVVDQGPPEFDTDTIEIDGSVSIRNELGDKYGLYDNEEIAEWCIQWKHTLKINGRPIDLEPWRLQIHNPLSGVSNNSVTP